jgi:hypothetical protein
MALSRCRYLWDFDGCECSHGAGGHNFLCGELRLVAIVEFRIEIGGREMLSVYGICLYFVHLAVDDQKLHRFQRLCVDQVFYG